MNAEQRAMAGRGDAKAERDSPRAEDHYVKLAGGRWGIWRWVGLRAAGFAVAGVERLSAGRAAEAAELVIQAEDEAESLWQKALEALREDMQSADGARRSEISKALKKLKKGQVPEALPPGCSAEGAVKAFASACEEVARAYANYHTNLEEAARRISEEVRAIGRDQRFREAIIWQNHNALRSGIDPLLRKKPGEPRDSKDRRNEELIASYWQRYCAKNDTIGFFGPVGWARVVDEGEAITVRPGASLLSVRNVYIEGWCIDKLAEVLFKDSTLRVWLPPHKTPALQVERGKAILPFKEHIPLTAAESIALGACDGERTAKEIAALLLRDSSAEIETESQGYEVLENLHARGLVLWSPVIPQMPHPEQLLRRMLMRIDDEALRSKALEPLDELVACRDHVARAAGDAQALDAALTEFESKFVQLTGQASTRDEGKTYAGRTLIYEDCRRDIEVEIGPKILERMAEPLSLILASARWLTYVTAEDCRAIFKEVYSQLRSEMNEKVIGGALFWARVQPHLLGSNNPFGNSLQSRFRDRWAEILAIPSERREVKYSSEQLRPRVLAAFDAPHSGWQYARYQCPDFMIAAESAEAIRRGEFKIVLGELHVALHTLSSTLFVSQHPSPDSLFHALEIDIPKPRLVHAPPKAGHSSRDTVLLTSPKDFYLEVMAGTPSPTRSQALQIGSLFVEEQAGQLVVRTLDGHVQFDIMEALASLLTWQVMNSFKLVDCRGYTPRISLDDVIIAREQWEFKAEEMEFAFEKQESQRFLAARRWAASLGLPRLLFYKSPVEVKPCYLDLDSPIYVNLFSRIIRKTAAGQKQTITLSEMLPAPSDVWLGDAAGNRYTSEMRLVALDLTS